MSEDKLEIAFQSADLSTRLTAVERAALDPTRYAQRVVALIPQFPNDAYFILERVSRFGDAVVPCLVELAESTKDERIRLLAALGLAHFKRVIDDTTLLNAIRHRSEYQCLACRALGWLGNVEVLPSLLTELRVTSPETEWYRMESLLDAITKLGGTISSSERERLIASGPPLTRATLDLFEKERVG